MTRAYPSHLSSLPQGRTLRASTLLINGAFTLTSRATSAWDVLRTLVLSSRTSWRLVTVLLRSILFTFRYCFLNLFDGLGDGPLELADIQRACLRFDHERTPIPVDIYQGRDVLLVVAIQTPSHHG